MIKSGKDQDYRAFCIRLWQCCEYRLTLLVLLFVALVATMPLLARFKDAIPAGSEPATVALFQYFTVGWTGLAIEGEASYWYAPFFHPHRGVFAWSEPQPISSLLIWAGSKLVGGIAAYNTLLLLFMVMIGMAGYALVRMITGDRAAALWSGISLTTGGCLMQQLGVLHLAAFGLPALSILSAFRYLKCGERRALVAVFMTCLFTWGTCLQFGLLLTMILPVALLPFLGGVFLRKLIGLLFSVGAAVLLFLPIALAQRFHLTAIGFERLLDDVKGVLRWSDLILPASGHWLTGGILGLSASANYYSWSIGIVSLVLIISGAAAISDLWRAATDFQRRMILSLVIIIVFSLAVGFGPRVDAALGFDGHGPYAIAFQIIPGVSGMRSPARAAFFAVLSTAVLGGISLANLRARFATSRSLLLFIAYLALVLEVWNAPIALVYPKGDTGPGAAAVAWLASDRRDTPLLEIPMSSGGRPADFEAEVRSMLRMLGHRRAIVNGYSGYFPPSFEQLRSALHADPLGKGLRYVSAYAPLDLLIHKRSMHEAQAAALTAALKGIVLFESEDHLVLAVESSGVRAPRVPSLLPGRYPRRPLPGEIAAVRLAAPAASAFLFLAAGEEQNIVQFYWLDDEGREQMGSMNIRGSVLIDKGQDSIYLKILKMPARHAGEAVLVAHETVP